MHASAIPDAKTDQTAAPNAPLVLLPGFLETAAIWKPLLDRHPDLAAPIEIAPLPGHGPGAPEVARLAGNAFIEDAVARLRKRFPHRRVRLVGHSTGGLVALSIALRHPDIVRAVMLIDPICSGRLKRFDTLLARMLTDRHVGPAVSAAVHRASLSPLVFPRLSRTRSAGRETPLPDTLRRDLVGCDAAVLRRVLIWLTGQCLLDRLDEIGAPVLSVIGRFDPVVPPAHQIALLKRLPNARAMLLHAGHLPFIEAPEAFDRSFRYWIDQDRAEPATRAS